MLGLLPVETRFDVRRLSLGYRFVTAGVETPLGLAGQAFRGHEFHYSTMGERLGDTDCLFTIGDAAGTILGDVGSIRGRVFGSYVHLIDLA